MTDPAAPPVTDGTPMPARFCSSCGAKRAVDDNFCPRCGVPLGSNGGQLPSWPGRSSRKIQTAEAKRRLDPKLYAVLAVVVALAGWLIVKSQSRTDGPDSSTPVTAKIVDCSRTVMATGPNPGDPIGIRRVASIQLTNSSSSGMTVALTVNGVTSIGSHGGDGSVTVDAGQTKITTYLMPTPGETEAECMAALVHAAPIGGG